MYATEIDRSESVAESLKGCRKELMRRGSEKEVESQVEIYARRGGVEQNTFTGLD